MSIDLDKLERLAKAATSGPWSWYAKQTVDGDSWAVFDSHDHALAMNTDGWVLDAEFIAATDPQTILALVARVREAEARIEKVREMHRPVHAVFSWDSGLRYEEPCPDCHGKAGVHECGCWADEDVEFVCRECDRPKSAQGRRGDLWPCETVKALTEGDKQ